jgi:phage terminase large subunit
MASSLLLPWAVAILSVAMRFKVFWGGRGSGKSWMMARALVWLGAQGPLRVLCCRELQTSIRDSVLRLLSDQIDILGLGAWYDVGESFIRGKEGTRAAGTEFIFKGLHHNSKEIKSLEGIDICWVEEAQAVSEDSWRLLIPTIRKPGSEIWITFNPVNEDDPTYKRFVLNPPANASTLKVNWDMNPFFPEELREEMEHMRKTDPDGAAHVWDGECISRSDAQVYGGKWSIEAFEAQAGWHGPYYGIDFGFAPDATAAVKLWVETNGITRQLYVEHELYGVRIETVDLAPRLVNEVPGIAETISRGDCARPETISHLQRHGLPKHVPCQKWTGIQKDGIDYIRGFSKIVVHPRCKNTANEFRLYRCAVDRLSGQVLPKVVEANDHAMNAIVYALEPVIKGELDRKKSAQPVRLSMSNGWG